MKINNKKAEENDDGPLGSMLLKFIYVVLFALLVWGLIKLFMYIGAK
jgi:hypothetical protein